MENIIGFNLKGLYAHFRNPFTNVASNTYSNIHKVALIGLLGNILGIPGWNTLAISLKEKTTENLFPEFYKRLNGLKVSICPKEDIFPFKKQVQRITDNTAFFNDGKNQIFLYQYLINPSWDIYLMQGECSEDDFKELQRRIKCRVSWGSLYLGKATFAAEINPINEEMKVIEQIIGEGEDVEVTSLFPTNMIDELDSVSTVKFLINWQEYLPNKLKVTKYYEKDSKQRQGDYALALKEFDEKKRKFEEKENKNKNPKPFDKKFENKIMSKDVIAYEEENFTYTNETIILKGPTKLYIHPIEQRKYLYFI